MTLVSAVRVTGEERRFRYQRLLVGAVEGDVSGGSVTPTGAAAPMLLETMAGRAQKGAVACQRTIAWLGDSMSVGYTSNATGVFHLGYSFPGMFQAISRQRFYTSPDYDFGVSGDITAEAVVRLDDVIAAQPDIVVVLLGTNDIYLSVGPATTIANLNTIYESLLAIGCTVVAIPILGRSSSGAPLTDTQRNYGRQVNDWIRRQNNTRRGLLVADCGLVWDDPTSTTWAERTNMTHDNLHENQNGAYVVARRVLDILDPLFPDWFIPVTGPTDIWHTTENPWGNLLGSAGMFAGTSGSIVDGSATGNIATGWGLSSSTMSTATGAASKVTLSDGRDAQQFAISGTYSGTGRYARFYKTMTAANFASGDEVESFIEFSIGTNENIRHINLEQRTTEGGTVYTTSHGLGLAGYAIPTAGLSGILRTPSRVLSAAPTVVDLFVYIGFTDGGTDVSGTVQLSSAATRKVRP